MTDYAFPALHFDLAPDEHGMTLRDYFAAKALSVAFRASDMGYCDEEMSDANLAKGAYRLADAMLEARK